MRRPDQSSESIPAYTSHDHESRSFADRPLGDIAEGDGIALITTDELVKQSFALLKKGAVEIRPGQAKQLVLMRRLAPDFINRQL
jgi:hypothetical protein